VRNGLGPRPPEPERTATIEVVDERARVLAVGRYGTDKAGYAQMLAAGRTYTDRVWAVEGCNGRRQAQWQAHRPPAGA
jgi:hypothetical protein